MRIDTGKLLYTRTPPDPLGAAFSLLLLPPRNGTGITVVYIYEKEKKILWELSSVLRGFGVVYPHCRAGGAYLA